MTTKKTATTKPAAAKKTAVTKPQPADIKPATTFEASGAPDQVVSDVDPQHPAVDANPRQNTTNEQNRIDFNDPTRRDADVVAEQLGMNAKAAD